ncbi:MAG: peptidoglycan editing factor PgeF [Clostridium sp.]|nr:peptidoglycan editing factor PgeF [Clostridium sp.]MCM1400175.1 peptidoglycan editing factor PgeF [Clostridium sp.]MCM1460907.1 peptidoglycan editing factor PgeF [Bacteroides sp.]
MERKKFDLRLMDGEILRRQEGKLTFIPPFFYEGERSTYIDYSLVKGIGDDALVPVIKYKLFSEYSDMRHGFSTRMGGTSHDHLATMNLSFSRGDDRENVIANHKRFAAAVGYDWEKTVLSDQVHKTQIYKVTARDAGKGVTVESDIKETDALMTNERGIPLMTFYADCVPIFFYDPVKKVVALAHSGWKGTVAKISETVIQAMGEEYGSSTSDILCAIGPSICQACYEVSDDVIQEFMKTFGGASKNFFYGKENGKYQLNLHAACKHTLRLAGVPEDNIAMPDLCTCCNPNVLFSHRASHGMRGNLSAVIMLAE